MEEVFQNSPATSWCKFYQILLLLGFKKHETIKCSNFVTNSSTANSTELYSKHKLCYIKMLLEKTSYMLVCTIYILVGMAITTTIIELVRYPKTLDKVHVLNQLLAGENMLRAGGKCKNSELRFKPN